MARVLEHRCDRCGGTLARDNTDGRCASCVALERRGPSTFSVPPGFWTATETMQEALADRHIGRVIRAYRTHPHHGPRPLSQELVAEWLGITQSKLSRVETGPRIDRLDLLIHWARALRIPGQYLWFSLPQDHEAAMEAGADVNELDSSHSEPPMVDLWTNSATRTRRLLETVRHPTATRLHYLPPVGAVEHVTEFLQSSSRVFTIKGPPGSGKTELTYHLAASLAEDAGFQLHVADSWAVHQVDLVVELLHYASIPRGDDPVLTLERHVEDLTRPCLAVIDGIRAQEQFKEIGRQVDWILRQVISPRLRFLLVVRTPPDIDFSAHPVLASSVYERPPRTRGTSYLMTRWEASEAQEVWNRSQREGEPTFSKLPRSIRELARLPLHMHLLRSAGPRAGSGDLNAYQLIDHCVDSLIRSSGRDVDQAVEMLADLAQHQSRDLVPPQLVAGHNPSAGGRVLELAPGIDVPPLTSKASSGLLGFQHDVFREYFLAARIARLTTELGRSASTVAAFNSLAAEAVRSATARGVFDFVVCRLDNTASELLESIAVSPTVNVATTLPLMMELGGDRAKFATGEVLRLCASRCVRDSALELAKALLSRPTMAAALGDDHASWIISLLRKFGSSIWADVTRYIELALDVDTARRLRSSADLEQPDDATFFARYFFLLFADDQESQDVLETLLGHADWRVRAALAEGLRAGTPNSNAAWSIMGRLAQDRDYKVRAAVAKAVGNVPPALAKEHLRQLLTDDNWHVRECLLHGLLSAADVTPAASSVAHDAIAILTSVSSWRHCPTSIGTLAQRLFLLHRFTDAQGRSLAHETALFILLREVQTGWAQLPPKVRADVVDEGLRSPSRLVVHEAEILSRTNQVAGGNGSSFEPSSSHERFRRLRHGRSIQVALDLHDLDQATEVAAAATGAGVDFIEVGDPLIKQVGLAAVSHIKRHVPKAAVIAEMMSADWGRDQVELAVVAGADVVLLIGPATSASVSAAVAAGQRLGVPIVLDVPAQHLTERWIRDMERVGVDGFTITTNIDLGVGGRQPLARARAVRGWTSLPVAVSGGFSATDHAIIGSADWDILIVGRSIVEAVQPAAAARQLVQLVHNPTRKFDEGRPV